MSENSSILLTLKGTGGVSVFCILLPNIIISLSPSFIVSYLRLLPFNSNSILSLVGITSLTFILRIYSKSVRSIKGEITR